MHTPFIEMPREYNHIARCDEALKVEHAKLIHAGINAISLPHLWSFKIPDCINARTGSDTFSLHDARGLRHEKRGRTITEGDV